MYSKISVFQRILNFGNLLAVVLTVLNVVMYLNVPMCDLHEPSSEKLLLLPVPSQTTHIFQDLRLGRWDSQRLYRMFDNIIVGENFISLSSKSRLTLATLSDADHLHHMCEVARHWHGPISVALFAKGEEDIIVLEAQLQFLQNCDRETASRISFHLALPKKFANGTWDLKKLSLSLNELRQDLDCLLLGEAFQRYVNLWKPDKEAALGKEEFFPQNHLRNLARKNSQTSYVFLADVDIVPCLHLWERVEEFLSESADVPNKVAYVVPVYEVDEKASFPKSKNEIVSLANQGLARSFHKKIFEINQALNNYERWQRENDSDGALRIAYTASKYQFGYEPFYIASDDAPPHDERFVGFGFTRNTQVYEMVVAGYKFLVLSPVFAVHWGFQALKSRPKWRGMQVFKNSKQFKTFTDEVKVRYSATRPKSNNNVEKKSTDAL